MTILSLAPRLSPLTGDGSALVLGSLFRNAFGLAEPMLVHVTAQANAGQLEPASVSISTLARFGPLFVFALERSAPLFGIVLGGYLAARLGYHFKVWSTTWTSRTSRFVFLVPLPALLFHMMSKLSSLPAVDFRLLGAFFGGAFIVFAMGRLISGRWLRLDGVGQSIFGLAGIFSNNVLLGLPLAERILGPSAVPCVALVLVFNALTLWTLATVSVEWARQGSFSLPNLRRLAWSVLTNPIVASILLGTAFGLSGAHLPQFASTALEFCGKLAGPAALAVLGLGLADYGLRDGLKPGLIICLLKLLLLPTVVWLLALAWGLPELERRVIVLLSSMSVGVNVYLMAQQFRAQQSTVAASMVLSTALAAVTTPLVTAVLY